MPDLKDVIARRGRFARIRSTANEVRLMLARLDGRAGPLSPAEAIIACQIDELARLVEDLAMEVE